MKDILIRVKRVSHANRVSSIYKPAKYIGMLLAAVVFLLPHAIATHASDITSQKVIDLANADRKGGSLEKLTENDKLTEAAAAKAEDMITDDYFSHTAPDGTTPWRWIEKAGYDYNYAGENLAMDFVSADKMNRAWLASPTHRANILNEKYKDIGVAVREGIINGRGTIAVVQMFGSGDNSAASAKENKSIAEKKITVTGTRFPQLPPEADEIRSEKKNRSAPVITSPQSGQVLPGRDIDVFGRAEQGAAVNLFDGKKPLANAVADGEGWFHAKVSNPEEGNHVLEAKSEDGAYRSEVVFAVDAAKPKIKYQLSAADTPDEITLEVFSDEPDCMFNVGTERVFSSSGKYMRTLAREKWLSLALQAEDAAGNKTFGDINLSSYYVPTGKNLDVIGKFAGILAPQKIFAADSGIVALEDNMGLAMGGEYNY